MIQITKEQAIGLYETKFWEKMTHEEIVNMIPADKRIIVGL